MPILFKWHATINLERFVNGFGLIIVCSRNFGLTQLTNNYNGRMTIFEICIDPTIVEVFKGEKNLQRKLKAQYGKRNFGNCQLSDKYN